jgi:hypothetical protein
MANLGLIDVNTMRTYIQVSICVYVLVAILKKELGIERNLSEILQILSISLFEKVEICQVLTATPPQIENPCCPNQLELFDL